MKYLFYIIIILLVLLAGYFIGGKLKENEIQKTVLQSYGYVKEIAELATIEVSGNTNLNTTNVSEDAGIINSIRKTLFEKSVKISVPYIAKYGIDMKDKKLRIERTDSVVSIYLPLPKLLSYELQLDKLNVTNKKGWFMPSDEEIYTKVEQQLYLQGRQQLENNQVYLNECKHKIDELLSSYFKIANLQVQCIFDENTKVQKLQLN